MKTGHILLVMTLIGIGSSCFASAKNAYEVLGVTRKATKAEISEAFRKLAKDHHPQNGSDGAKFRELSQAYEKIKTDEARAEYDEHLKLTARSSGRPYTSSPRNGRHSHQGTGWADGPVSDEDIQSFKRVMENHFVEAYANSKGSALGAFFQMFYTDQGHFIDASTMFYATTGKRQIADHQIQHIHRSYFHKMARHIWFVGESSSTILRFERDFSGEKVPLGIVRHMMSMYDRIEESNATAMFSVNKKGTEEFAKASVADVLGVLNSVCILNIASCVKELVFQMDERAPKIYGVLNEDSVELLVTMIEYAMRNYQTTAFSREYFQLMRIRNNIASLNQNIFRRTYSCASMMTTKSFHQVHTRFLNWKNRTN